MRLAPLVLILSCSGCGVADELVKVAEPQSSLTQNSMAMPARPTSDLTIGDVRTLPVAQLARELLGERLGSRVIEVVRHEYESANIPQAVDLYMQPVTPWPRVNRICRVDVITVEYNWYEVDGVQADTPIGIAHVEAASRYKSFPEPRGEPGSPEYDRASEAACANFRTALDAFRAPTAGDAQLLAAIEQQYTQPVAMRRFRLGCRDPGHPSCALAGQVLPSLALNKAHEVREVDCPAMQERAQLSSCYRLSFRYSGTEDLEWVMSIMASIRDGMAPVEIRALLLEHFEPPIRMH